MQDYPMAPIRRVTDSGLAFLVGELEKQEETLREPLAAVTWPRDIVARTGGGWVDQTSLISVDYASASADGIIGSESSAIPVMQADLERDTSRVFTFGHVLKVPFADQAKLTRVGRSLEELLAKGVRLTYQKSLDQNVYRGYAAYGSEGLVNSSRVTVSSAATVSGSTAWSGKTADEIAADVNDAIIAVWSACDYDPSAVPNHILLPPAAYAALAARKAGSAGELSLLNYLIQNNPAAAQGRELAIVPCRWCAGAGNGGSDRMVVYVNDPDKVSFDITVPLTRVMTEASAADMAYLTAFAAQHSEVRFAFPQSARYVDGI